MLHGLRCSNAVVTTSSFQTVVEWLHRSHPSVFVAVAKLEGQLSLSLLGRGGCRVRLTEAGRSLHRRVQSVLREGDELRTHTKQLMMDEETKLRVASEDLCPLKPILALLS